MDKIEKTGKEIVGEILAEKDNRFEKMVISGDIELTGLTTENLNFNEVVVNGHMRFLGTAIEEFYFRENTINNNNIDLSSSKFGFLSLNGTKIKRGNLFGLDISVQERLYLEDVIVGDIMLDRLHSKGLYLNRSLIKGDLDLSEANIKGDLNLSGATIRGSLNLSEAIIEGSLDLSFKKCPLKIYVSTAMAQLVHWAAPTTPLVVLP